MLTDIPPCKNYTAGIVLNILCDFLLDAGHEVSCFAVVDPALDAKIPPDKQERMSFQLVQKPRESWGHTMLKGFGSWLGNGFTARFRLPEIARQAGTFCRDKQADLIWSIVQGQTMIKITEPAARYGNVPYFIQVWDPPEWWMLENRFDRFTQKSVMKAFASALHHSQKCLAASWAMADDYSEKYDCSAVPVILGFSPGRVSPAGIRDERKFVIALSGQIYAENEFNALVTALNRMHWEHNGKQIVLRLYGRYFHLYFSECSRIEIRGWMEQDQLLPELADADLLYCPYWFDEAHRLPTTLSFPSKLSTYLKTARPVLIHAPEYASPRRYLVQRGAGYICDTMDPNGIASLLSMIMDLSEQDRQALGEQGYQAFLNTLTTAHMREAFLSALGLNTTGSGD